MRIGAFCAATGLSRDTVRFYEREGLLRPRVGASGTNTYREFDAAMVDRVRGIQRAKDMGFSLREIRSLATAFDRNPRDRAAQARWLREKLVDVDARIRAAREMKAHLLEKLARLESDADA